MGQPDLANRLNEAITLINAGRRPEARAILLDLSQQHPQSESVWMWRAAAAEDTDERISYLRRVLGINPRNDKARAALTRLTGQAPPAPEGLTAASSPQPSGQSIETLLIGILVFALVVGAVVLLTAVASNLLNPRPTATPIPSLTHTPLPTLTRTPSITPGGPTLTFPVGRTLPPSWTPQPSNTPAPTRTLADTLTPLPTFTPSQTPLPRPSWTPLPTFTPGGLGLPTRTPSPGPTPTGTLSTPTGTETGTGTVTSTSTATPTASAM